MSEDCRRPKERGSARELLKTTPTKKHERVSNNHEKRYLGKSRLSSTSWAVQKKVLFLHELRSHHNIPWSKTTSTHKKAKKRVAVQDLVGHHLKEPVIMRDFGQPTWNSGLVDEILSTFLGGWFRSNIEKIDIWRTIWIWTNMGILSDLHENPAYTTRNLGKNLRI